MVRVNYGGLSLQEAGAVCTATTEAASVETVRRPSYARTTMGMTRRSDVSNNSKHFERGKEQIEGSSLALTLLPNFAVQRTAQKAAPPLTLNVMSQK